MSKLGSEIATDSLRELQVLDPTATASGEQLEDALRAAADLLDTWRIDRLTIGGVTRSVYSLVADTQSYTIGPSGTFDQAYPTAIERWSVIPDDDATDVVEWPRGRPVTEAAWQGIAQKSLTAAYPHTLWFDRSYASGLGNCLFYPVPDHGDVDLVLYAAV